MVVGAQHGWWHEAEHQQQGWVLTPKMSVAAAEPTLPEHCACAFPRPPSVQDRHQQHDLSAQASEIFAAALRSTQSAAGGDAAGRPKPGAASGCGEACRLTGACLMPQACGTATVSSNNTGVTRKQCRQPAVADSGICAMPLLRVPLSSAAASLVWRVRCKAAAVSSRRLPLACLPEKFAAARRPPRRAALRRCLCWQ